MNDYGPDYTAGVNKVGFAIGYSIVMDEIMRSANSKPPKRDPEAEKDPFEDEGSDWISKPPKIEF